MADPIDPAIIERGLSALADNIVNPKCEDCGRSLSFSKPTPGPHQCLDCQQKAERRFQAGFYDWKNQERPRGRTIHVIKLPECMGGPKQ